MSNYSQSYFCSKWFMNIHLLQSSDLSFPVHWISRLIYSQNKKWSNFVHNFTVDHKWRINKQHRTYKPHSQYKSDLINSVQMQGRQNTRRCSAESLMKLSSAKSTSRVCRFIFLCVFSFSYSAWGQSEAKFTATFIAIRYLSKYITLIFDKENLISCNSHWPHTYYV